MTRIALVTGGNRGIGLEICRRLALQGITVLLGSRDLARGQAAAAGLADAGGGVVEAVRLDVTSEEDIQALYSFVEARFGRLDILINNAAIYEDRVHRLAEVDPHLLRRTMVVNAWAPLRLAQVFIPLMRRHSWGRIVNVTSRIGELGGLGSSFPTYRLSKINLNLITRILAGELRGTGIKINAVFPGWVRTDMGGPGAPRSVEEGADTAVWLATLPDDGPHGGYFRDRRPIPW